MLLVPLERSRVVCRRLHRRVRYHHHQHHHHHHRRQSSPMIVLFLTAITISPPAASASVSSMTTSMTTASAAAASSSSPTPPVSASSLVALSASPNGSSSSSSGSNGSSSISSSGGSGSSSNAVRGSSPLDVTFLLYTRHNRDLAQDLTHLSLTNFNPSSGSSTTCTPNILHPRTEDTSELLLDAYTNSDPDQHQLDQQQQQQQLITPFNSSLPIKIIIHGFGSGGRRPWVTDMVHKLLDYEDVNVIVVDWEKGAVLPNYVQAAGNTRTVGHRIATLIKTLNLQYGLTGNRYHLIGFSLGAHVAGFAGMEIRNTSGLLAMGQPNRNVHHWTLNRITGLDPASPLFEGYEANDRLDPSDAQFVDVIHSNGDGVLRGGFGSLQPMGHVDFYPNGGRVQVGCNSVILSALSDIIYGKWQSLCNHRRALNFFMDSFEFSRCRFRSFNCDSYENYLRGECFDCGVNNEKCSYMGYLANYSKGRGKMYLTTHEEAPFCANQFIIKIIGSKGYKTHWGKVEVTLVTVDGKNESFWLSSSMMSGSGTGSGATTSSTTAQAISLSPASMSASGSSQSTASLSSLAPSTLSPPTSGFSQSPSNLSADIMTTASSLTTNSISHKELSQQSMQSLIVAHPMLVNFTQIHLRYTKYKGWIYSGDENWPIDKVFITDSDGQMKSFCGHNTILESHITTRLNLEPGDCTVLESPATAPPATLSSASPQMSPSATLTSNSISPMSRVSSTGGGGGQAGSGSSHLTSPSRTPRLLASMMHHQNSGPVNSMAEHHLQQQQQQQQLQQTPLMLTPHGHAIQRILSPHNHHHHHHHHQQQQQQHPQAPPTQFAMTTGNAAANGVGPIHQALAHQILSF